MGSVYHWCRSVSNGWRSAGLCFYFFVLFWFCFVTVLLVIIDVLFTFFLGWVLFIIGVGVFPMVGALLAFADVLGGKNQVRFNI